MVDIEGRRFLDLAMGFGVYLHGHGAQASVHATWAEAAASGSRDGGNDGAVPSPGLGDLYSTDLRNAANARLCSWAAAQYPGTAIADDLRALVVQSGSEAVETAIKTALLATGRERIIAFEGAYHGTFGMALSVTHREDFREPFAAQHGGTVRFAPWGQVPVVDERVACVVVEPIQGRAGVLEPPAGFLAGLRDQCDEVGALLIVDSVLVGCGRTGELLTGAGCDPDIIAVGKALGGGIPASATIARTIVAEAAWGGGEGEAIHTATYIGHPLSCAAVLHTLDVLLPGADLGQHDAWHATLAPVAELHGWDLRGRGLLWALDTGRPGGGVELARRLLDSGVIVAPSGAQGSSITLTPSVLVSDDERTRLASLFALD